MLRDTLRHDLTPIPFLICPTSEPNMLGLVTLNIISHPQQANQFFFLVEMEMSRKVKD